MLVVAAATALKVILPGDLADQIIAAWFVGQGFALQHHVQSYISGIKVRSNTTIWSALYEGADVTYPDDDHMYRLAGQDVFAITLCASADGAKMYRVIPWTAVDNLVITQH